jgi:lipoate---protein ligase
VSALGERWRLLDTGLRSAAQNVALHRALLEARRAEEIPSTLHFFRNTPCVLIGAQHGASHAIDVASCRSLAVPIQRRITSGQSAYSSESQISWALYLQQRDIGPKNSRATLKRFCHAVATAVSALGTDARYRAPDEIEVDGRQIGFAAAAYDGPALLIEGMLMVHGEEENVARLLRLPVVTDARGYVREHIAGLKELLGHRADPRAIKHNVCEAFESELEVEFTDGDLSLSEQTRHEALLPEMQTSDWDASVGVSATEVLVGEHKADGERLRAIVMYDAPAACIRRVGFEADVRVQPRRTLPDLEAALRDTPVTRLGQKIEWFFASRPAAMDYLKPADFIAALRVALKQPLLA